MRWRVNRLLAGLLSAGGVYAPSAPVAPGLDSLEPYRVGVSNVFANVPWGPTTWLENGLTYSQQVTFYAPANEVPVPAGGRPVICRYHAASSAYDIPPGSGLDTELVVKANAKGMIVVAVSAGHPSLSSTPENFRDREFSKAVQFIRSYSGPLQMNVDRFHVFSQSRGSNSLNDLLLDDLQDLNGPTWASRQKSGGFGLMRMINPQCYHRSLSAATEFLATQADIDAMLAAYPQDTRQRNAVDLLATAPIGRIPKIQMHYDTAFQVGKVSWDVMRAQENGGVTHYAKQGEKIREAMIARGLGNSVNLADQSDGFANIAGDFIDTIELVDQGLSLPEAATILLARRRDHSVFYLRDPASGVTTNSDGSGGAPALGGVVGGVVDGSYGIPNRSAVPPLGRGAGQNTTANKPKYTQVSAGKFGLTFDSTDKLICQIPNSGTPDVAIWTTDSFSKVALNKTASAVTWSAGDGKIQVLAVVSATEISHADLKYYSSLASEISGNLGLFELTN